MKLVSPMWVSTSLSKSGYCQSIVYKSVSGQWLVVEKERQTPHPIYTGQNRKDFVNLFPDKPLDGKTDNLYMFASMTTLLTHTVAHSTKPSFMPRTNNQPPKKFLSLALKVVKNGNILTFKVNFLCQKITESFQEKNSLKNMILGAHFLLLTFFENFNF